jgi:hypothetical protein
MSHPDDSTIDRFAMGALDDTASFVAHVGGCEECSRKLRRAAEIELAMFDVPARAAISTTVAEARAPGALPVCASLARRALGPTLAFAAAAAILLWAGRERLRSRRDPAGGGVVQVVSCPEGPKQIECIAQAHRSGAQLEYPKGTSLAALGSEPGFTVDLVPRFSEGVLVDTDEFLTKVKADLMACANRAIVSQDAPLRTGEVGVKFSIASGGRVEVSEVAIVLSRAPAIPGPEDSASSTDLVLGRCLRSTIAAFPFKSGVGTTRVSLSARYVWRE